MSEVEAEVHHVSCGMLIRSERVLLAHRSPAKTWYPDVWDFPGGHIESGESSEQALVRELREELGIDIEAPGASPVLVVRDEGVVLDVWRVDQWQGEVRNAAPNEHDEIGWFTCAEAERLNLADQAYAPLLDRLLR